MAGWREHAAAAGLALLVTACAVSAGNSVPAGQAQNAPGPASRSGFVEPATRDADTLAAVVAAARLDAARAWQVADVASLQVTSQDVTWSDGSLGCPQPGRMYAQALVPGWRVLVRAADGREGAYHASRRGQWLWCPPGRAQAPGGGGPVER